MSTIVTRLSRRNRTAKDLGLSAGYKDMYEIFDEELKMAYRINQKEMDYLDKVLNDEEWLNLLEMNPDYSQVKTNLKTLQKHLTKYRDLSIAAFN